MKPLKRTVWIEREFYVYNSLNGFLGSLRDNFIYVMHSFTVGQIRSMMTIKLVRIINTKRGHETT